MKARKSRALRKVLAAGLAAALAATMTPALALAGERSIEKMDAPEIIHYYTVTFKPFEEGDGEGPGMVRVYGDTRYGTSQAMSDYSWRTGYGKGEGYGNGVIIASGASFADALSASGLAGALDYPVLLTNPNSMTKETIEALKYLVRSNEAPLDVVIVGGDKAVSKKVESDLLSKGFASNVTRVAGANRYDTSLEVYKYGVAENRGWNSIVVVATGKTFPDALAISPFCAWNKAPVILVGDSLTKAQADFLAKGEMDSKSILIVGGERAVSKAIENEFTYCSYEMLPRCEGNDRYETAMEIVNFELNIGMDMMYPTLVTGANYPDALTAGPYAGETADILFLVDPSGKCTMPVFQCLSYYAEDIDDLWIVGGPGAVSTDFENQLFNIIAKAKASEDASGGELI